MPLQKQVSEPQLAVIFDRHCDSCKKSLHTTFYQPISSARFKIQIKCNCENSDCDIFNKEKLGCCFCEYSCVKSDTLLKHIEKEHTTKFPKLCCDKHYTTMAEYIDHVNFKHQTNTKTEMAQPLKKLCLRKPEKPIQLKNSTTVLQHVITPQNDVLQFGGLDSSWAPTDKNTELDVDWKILPNETEINLQDVNPYDDIEEQVVVDSDSNNPLKAYDPNNKYTPFESELEWRCFMMLKSKQYTKEQYLYTTKTIEMCGKTCLSYDQIQTRCEHFKTQEPIIDEKDSEHEQYVYYSIVDCIKYLYADPFIAKKIHNGNKPEDSAKEPLFNYEPYASKGFQELKAKCESDETPIVIMPYIDEYQKHRTGTSKTAGLYFTLLNFDRKFLTTHMESISVLGNSKTNISQFRLLTKFVKELNEIDGKSIEVYNSSKNSIEKIRILIGPWIWDSVQRWFSLFLEKHSCSKCKCPKDDFCKCPDDISKPLVYPKRTVAEAVEMQQKLSIGKIRNGYKFVTVKDIEIKDLEVEYRCKAKKAKDQIHQKKNTQMENPLLQLKGCDIFENSTVELMHGSVQGDLRRHLKIFLRFFDYTNISSDFQIVMDKYTNNHGKALKMKANDYKKCSADEFLEFVVFSCPIMYDFLINNKHHVDISFELKKKHLICWSNHVEYVLSLIQDLVSDSNIETAKLKHFNFRNQVISLYGNGNFTNPNFHWNTHIFEDCSKWGNARFFWALLFELKHKDFKQFNDSSNHKHLEQRGANFEKLQRQININYPWARNSSEDTTWIPIVSEKQCILFKAKDGSLLVGQFVELKEQNVYFVNIKKCLSSVHPIIGYRMIDSNIHSMKGFVSTNRIIGKCLIHIIDGVEMFNQYSFFMNFHKVKF